MTNADAAEEFCCRLLGFRPEDEVPAMLATSPGDPLVGTHYASLNEVADEAKAVIVQFRGQLGKVGSALDNIKSASEDVKKVTGDVRDLGRRQAAVAA